MGKESLGNNENDSWMKVAKQTAQISFLFSVGLNAGDISKKLKLHPVTIRRYRQLIRKAYEELK